MGNQNKLPKFEPNSWIKTYVSLDVKNLNEKTQIIANPRSQCNIVCTDSIMFTRIESEALNQHAKTSFDICLGFSMEILVRKRLMIDISLRWQKQYDELKQTEFERKTKLRLEWKTGWQQLISQWISQFSQTLKNTIKDKSIDELLRHFNRESYKGFGFFYERQYFQEVCDILKRLIDLERLSEFSHSRNKVWTDAQKVWYQEQEKQIDELDKRIIQYKNWIEQTKQKKQPNLLQTQTKTQTKIQNQIQSQEYFEKMRILNQMLHDTDHHIWDHHRQILFELPECVSQKLEKKLNELASEQNELHQIQNTTRSVIFEGALKLGVLINEQRLEAIEAERKLAPYSIFQSSHQNDDD